MGIELKMRNYSLLILLLGAVASEPLFRPGKEYEYDYQGKLLSGIPVLDSQFAGLMIEGKIILQTLGTETYKLALKDVKYSKFNEKLTGSTEPRWAINLKKSLISLIMIQTPTGEHDLTQNSI